MKDLSKVRERIEKLILLNKQRTPGSWEYYNDSLVNKNRRRIASFDGGYFDEAAPQEIDAEFIALMANETEFLTKYFLAMLDALEMGAFHHNACPWLSGKECCCAHDKVDKILTEVVKDIE